MRQKCCQPIKTIWQMQQNMCCNQDNDDISSERACWSEYKIVSALSQVFTNSWVYQETALERARTIIGACLWWYSIVYQTKIKISLKFPCLFGFAFFFLLVCVCLVQW